MKRRRTQSVTSRPMKRRKAVGRAIKTRGPVMTKSVELKVQDRTHQTYQINAGGSFTLLHVPTLGTDYTNRIGRKTLIRSIFIRGWVEPEIAATAPIITSAPAGLYRMIIFVDNQPNGATPTVADLLNSATPSAMLNLDNRDRFRIFKDKTYTHGPITSITAATVAQYGADNVTKNVKVYMKTSIETVFDSTNGGTIADINSGALYMFWIGETAASVNDGNAFLSTRIRFTDL